MPDVDSVTKSLDRMRSTLTEGEKSDLSKVLFPDMHNKEIFLLGKVREFRPLVVKWSKKLRGIMQPYAKQLDSAVKSIEITDIDLELLEGIQKSARLIAQVYGWEDIEKAIDEEDLTTSEVQSIVVTQLNLQGENDFLLIPLRVACMVMQAVEIQNRRYRTIIGRLD